MPENAAALEFLRQAGIVQAGVCAFSPELVLSGARSARHLPNGAKSILVCLLPYFVGLPNGRNVALYGMLPDYHAVAGAMLSNAAELLGAAFPECSFACFVDSSPIDEVTAAVRAGLGTRGKNGLLITENYGQFVFLGEIVTDLALEGLCLDAVCEGCGRCIAACPTGALSEGGLTRAKCRSHLTQKKGPLTDWEQRQIAEGGLVWGCDLCALACPHNQRLPITPIGAFSADVTPVVGSENLDILLRNRAFAWRGREVLERNLRLLAGR